MQGWGRIIAAIQTAWHRKFMIISPAQCRAARGLLGISQEQLAAKSGVSLRAIANYETEKTMPIRANRIVLKQTLELMGVEFGDDGWMRLKPGKEHYR